MSVLSLEVLRFKFKCLEMYRSALKCPLRTMQFLWRRKSACGVSRRVYCNKQTNISIVMVDILAHRRPTDDYHNQHKSIN